MITRLISRCLWALPGRFALLDRLGPSCRLRTVLFHDVSEGRSAFTRGLGVTMDPDVFESRIAFLARHYQPVTLEQVLAATEGAALPERALLVTFDDAYASFWRRAAPVLRKHGMPAVFFVNAAFVDGATLGLDNLVCHTLNTVGLEPLDRAARTIEPRHPGFRDLGDVIDGFLAHLEPRRVAAFRAALLELLDDDPAGLARAEELYLSAAELRSLADAGFEIGNHSSTPHPLSEFGPGRHAGGACGRSPGARAHDGRRGVFVQRALWEFRGPDRRGAPLPAGKRASRDFPGQWLVGSRSAALGASRSGQPERFGRLRDLQRDRGVAAVARHSQRPRREAQMTAEADGQTPTEDPGYVSVLIVNWNTREQILCCLEGLANGALPERGEVIVVDNASSDGSADAIARNFPQVRLVRNEANVGFARAVNQAVRCARGDLLLLLNSDTELEPRTITTCRDFLLGQKDVAVVGCRLQFPDGRPQSSTFRFPSLRGVLSTSLWLAQAFPASWILNWDRYGNREWTAPRDVDVVMGSFLLLRRAALETELPLDEGYFMYGEESDMCRELAERGWRTVHLPDAILTHVQGGSLQAPALAGWGVEAKTRGILRFLWKWRGTRVAWLANLMMLLGLLPRCIVWGLTDLLQGFRSGRWRAGKIHKGRVLRFHLAVILRPRTLQENWRGPDALCVDHG